MAAKADVTKPRGVETWQGGDAPRGHCCEVGTLGAVGQSGRDRRGAHLKPTVSFGLGRKSDMGSMPFKFGLKMVGIDIIARISGGAEGTCDTTR